MKFSVVTPSFNQGRFLERTLASVATQRDDAIAVEHLVFDAGSTDDSAAILERSGSNVAWVSRPDRGQADAVNQGLRAARGDVIGWLNSDDVYYPGAFAMVSAYFADHPDVDVVYGMADHIDASDLWLEDYPTEAWNPERLRQTCFICQPALFMRRRVIESHGVLDDSLHYCMDYEYWLRLAKAGVRFAFLPAKLAGSRLYAENKTLGSRVKVHREINDMMVRLFGRVPDTWLFAYAHAVVEARMNKAANPLLFTMRIALVAFFSSMRWNHGMSATMIGTMSRRLRPRTVA